MAVLAVLATGCPIVALDPSFPEARNALIVKHAGMKAIVVDGTTSGLARLLISWRSSSKFNPTRETLKILRS